MKRTFALLLTLVILMSCTFISSHAEQTYPVTLTASAPASVTVGDTVDITVSVDTGTTDGLYTLNFTLEYDVTRLTFVSVTGNAPTGWTLLKNAKNGRVYVLSEAPMNTKGYYNPASGTEALTYTISFTATAITGETTVATTGSVTGTEGNSSIGLLYGSPFSVSATVHADDKLTVSEPLALRDGYLTGIPTATVPAAVAALCRNSERIAFFDADGNAVASDSSDYVGTGWTVALTDGNGNILDSAVAVISGDLNGNGIHDSNDCALVRNAYLGTVSLSDAANLAADVNQNGAIESNDYIRIRLSIVGDKW